MDFDLTALPALLQTALDAKTPLTERSAAPYAQMQYPRLLPLMRFSSRRWRAEAFGSVFCLSTRAMAEASQRALDAYLSLAGGLPLLEPEDRADKRRKAAAYVDGLLTHGGPSTDAFLRAIGPERTRALFTRIVFGTAE